MFLKKDLLEKFDELNILYKINEHEALFTVKDSEEKRGDIEGAHTKNLFLKNKKNQLFLFSCHEDTKIELKKLSKSLRLGNISFVKESLLMEYLGVLPGSVTPFGLLNDISNKVNFFFDSHLLTFNKINFHPLVNTSTITLNVSDFFTFLIENKKKINMYNFENYSLVE